MLPLEQPDPSAQPSETAPTAPVTLRLVTESLDAPAETPFETGLVRSLVVGGVLGFLLIFAIVTVGFLLAGIDPIAAIMSAMFVGAFGGIGFGAMTGGSIHKPPKR